MNEILTALITLLAGLVTAFLIPYLKAKLSEKQQAVLMTLIEIAVNAAEQLFKGEEKSGERKLLFVREFLKAQGIANTEKTDGMIESAVYKMTKGN